MAHVITDDCLGCGSCVDECPVEAIGKSNDVYIINSDLCTDCGNCKENCPTDAIREN